MKLMARLRRFGELLRIHGLWKTLSISVDWLVNRFLVLDAYVIVVLDRARLHRPKVVDVQPLTFRLATFDDLRDLRGRPGLDIDDGRLRAFLEGDACLLQYVDNELAGYTWAHAQGEPQLVPGLRIRIPNTYLYNYCSLTLPAYRGRNHQALRHHELLQIPDWGDRAGLMGYVRQANWSSRGGLSKSGYRELGRIWLAGVGDRVFTWIPPSLRKLGLERVSIPPDRQAELQQAITAMLEGKLAPAPEPANTAEPNVAVPPPARRPQPARSEGPDETEASPPAAG